MPGPIRLSEPCPSCGALTLDYSVVTWSGGNVDGEPTGGGWSGIRCAECGDQFGRGDGGVLTTPEAAAEYERHRMRELAARAQVVWDRRAREQARATVEGRAQDAAPDPAT